MGMTVIGLLVLAVVGLVIIGGVIVLVVVLTRKPSSARAPHQGQALPQGQMPQGQMPQQFGGPVPPYTAPPQQPNDEFGQYPSVEENRPPNA